MHTYHNYIKHRTDIILFVLFFVSYAYFYQGGGWNQNARFAQTRSIVETGTLNIDRFIDSTGDWSKYNGHYYPNKPPGISFLSVPFYFIINPFVKIISYNKPEWIRLQLMQYILTVIVSGLPAAFFSLIYYRFLFKFSDITLKEAIALAIIFQFSTLIFPYSTLFNHSSRVLVFTGGFFILFVILPFQHIKSRVLPD